MSNGYVIEVYTWTRDRAALQCAHGMDIVAYDVNSDRDDIMRAHAFDFEVNSFLISIVLFDIIHGPI